MVYLTRIDITFWVLRPACVANVLYRYLLSRGTGPMQVRSVPHSSRCMDSGVIKVAKLWENDKSGIKPEVHSAYFSKSLQRMQRKGFKNVPTIVPLENNNVQEHVLEINSRDP